VTKKTSKPKSRKEHDQIKRGKVSNEKPVSSSESIIEKCKKLVRRDK
jgi:hypothetical protein